MKVALISPYDWSRPGGVNTHIVGLESALTTRGIEVEIMAPASAVEEDIFVCGRPFAVRANGSVARICFSLASKKRIGDRLRAGDIHVVHAHEPLVPSSGLLAMMEAYQPVVATFHASRNKSLGYAIARPILGRFAAAITSRIAVSRAARSLAQRYFPGEYSIVPNGIDFNRFSDASPDAELESLKPFVLFVGRPEPRKGFDVALKAMDIVQREHPEIHFVAVGPNDRDIPKGMSSVRASCLGVVDQQRLPGIYAAADVFVAPSTQGESFGLVLIEAMAAGAPVVCSRLDGYMEAASGAALSARPGDAAGIAAEISKLLDDRTLAADIRRRGVARASQLDWDHLVENVLSLYEAAVS